MASVFGGAERTTANLLQYLDRGRVQRITLVAPEILRRQLPQGYDRFVDAADYALHSGFIGSRALRADAAGARALLRRVRPDIALGMMHYAAALIALGATGMGLPTVASLRGPFYEYMCHHEPQWRRRLFLRTIVTATALLADRVLVPSQGTKRELERRFLGRSRRIVVIPNGIDRPAAVQAARARVPDLEDLGKGPVLCTAARLAPEKNLYLLLAAFRRLHSARPARLIVVGDGPERAALEAQAARWGLDGVVRFVGHQPNVYPYLKRADLFIHTCLFEGFGYTILEAMACATPVIATDCPYGPREIIGDNAYGVLVPPNDAEALAAAIGRLLDDPLRRQALAARGLERAEALSIERMVGRYETVFAELAGGAA